MTDQSHIADPEALRLEAQAWIVRIRSGDATGADTAELMRWRAQSPRHEQALAEAIRVRRLIAAAAGERDVAGMSPWVPASRLGRRAFLGGAMAASAAGVVMVRPPLALWPSFAELRADYRTGVGEQRTIQLGNGASAELNTRTSASLLSDRRMAGLDLIAGEVAVDIPHATRPVYIRTPTTQTHTQAGRFVVRLEDAKTCVTCLAGTVHVKSRRGAPETLPAGYQLRYTDRKLGDAARVDVTRAEAWRRGLLMFVDEPLDRVVEEVNRYRPGRIVVVNGDLGRVLINAVFQLDRINTVVAQIRDVSNARVTSLPGGIVLLS